MAYTKGRVGNHVLRITNKNSSEEVESAYLWIPGEGTDGKRLEYYYNVSGRNTYKVVEAVYQVVPRGT